MNTKVCTKCGEEKGLGEFYKKRGYYCSPCKNCLYEQNKTRRESDREGAKEYQREYQDSKRGEIREQRKEYRERNKEQIVAAKKEFYQKNIESIKESKKKWRNDNKERIREEKRLWRELNKDRIKKQRRESYQKNKAKNRQRNKAWHSSKMQTDSIYALKIRIRANISVNLRSRGYFKCKSTEEIICCSIKELEIHLISTAIKNYGYWADFQKYEIDHITPLATATTEEDVIKLNHYTNLQFLYPDHNNSKRSRLDWELPK